MYKTAIVATMLGGLALGVGPAGAGPVSKAVQAAALSSELSSQAARQPRTRLRVYPGQRLLYRECSFRLAQERRPSGTVIVPRQRCWWVRG